MLNSAVLVSAWNKSYSMVEIRTIETFGNLVWNQHAKWHDNSSLPAFFNDVIDSNNARRNIESHRIYEETCMTDGLTRLGED